MGLPAPAQHKRPSIELVLVSIPVDEFHIFRNVDEVRSILPDFYECHANPRTQAE